MYTLNSGKKHLIIFLISEQQEYIVGLKAAQTDKWSEG